MFDHYCSTCAEALRSSSRARSSSLRHTEHGIEVAFTCWCGADQTWTRAVGGQHRRQDPVAA